MFVLFWRKVPLKSRYLCSLFQEKLVYLLSIAETIYKTSAKTCILIVFEIKILSRIYSRAVE